MNVGTLLLIAFAINSQQAPAPTRPLPPTQRLVSEAEMLNELTSSDWKIRALGIVQLSRPKNHDLLKAASVQATLIRLLASENDVVKEAYLAGVGISGRFGEEYSEYYAQLLDTEALVADRTDPKTLSILAQASYNPDSRFARELAETGQPLVQVVGDLANDTVDVRRINGIALAGHLLRLHRAGAVKQSLNSKSEQQLLALIRTAATDPHTVARRTAVRALADVGDRSDLPLLLQLAANDRDKSKRFTVADEAQRAVSSIQARGR